MKDILILLFVLFFPMIANAQDKPSFSFREVNHIRVATPGLFAKGNHIYLHLDSLKEHEYAFPLPGGKVISAYGTRGGHSGADIKTCANDTIRAANCKNLVRSGDVVKAGQPIGLTGRTGRATTEHVHFETRINGQHFNPNLIFDLKERKLRKECIKCSKNGSGIIVKSQVGNNRIAQNKK